MSGILFDLNLLPNMCTLVAVICVQLPFADDISRVSSQHTIPIFMAARAFIIMAICAHKSSPPILS